MDFNSWYQNNPNGIVILKDEINCVGEIYEDFVAIDSFGISVPEGYSKQLKNTYPDYIQDIVKDVEIESQSEKDEL